MYIYICMNIHMYIYHAEEQNTHYYFQVVSENGFTSEIR